MPTDPSPDAGLDRLAREFQDCRPRLLAMLRRRIDPALGRRLDPEDILQDTYLLAQRRWLQDPSAMSATPFSRFYRLALDCFIEAWRRETRGWHDVRKDVPWPEDSSVALGLGLVGGGITPGSAAQHQEVRRLVRQAVDGLRPKDREILGMRYFDGLTFAEAAHVLGIPENTAKVRHLRAIKRLHDAWQILNPPGKSLP